MATTSIPLSAHFAYLQNVTREEAERYARAFLEQRTVAPLAHFGIFPFSAGFIVEIQEGSAGVAYTPSLLSMTGASSALLGTATNTLLLHVGDGELSCAALPSRYKGEEFSQNWLAPSNELLTKVVFDHSKNVLVAAVVTFAVSVVVFLAAVFNSNPIENSVAPRDASELPIAKWAQAKPLAASEVASSFELVKGSWVVRAKALKQSTEDNVQGVDETTLLVTPVIAGTGAIDLADSSIGRTFTTDDDRTGLVESMIHGVSP